MPEKRIGPPRSIVSLVVLVGLAGCGPLPPAPASQQPAALGTASRPDRGATGATAAAEKERQPGHELEPPAVSPEAYVLDLRVDFEAERLEGAATVTVRNRSDAPVDHVPFLVYRLMELERVTDGVGAELTFTAAVRTFRDFDKLQALAVRVLLPAPLPPDSSVSITLEYGGPLVGYRETGMLYIRETLDPRFTVLRNDSYAFPLVGVPSLAANRAAGLPAFGYRARLAVPDTLVVVNAGRLVSVLEGRPGELVYEFQSREPSWRMDFAIGPYRTLDRGPIRIHYLARDSASAARVAGTAEAGLRYFEDRLGPLVGTPTLTIIELEEGFGSQADVSAILQAAAAFRDPDRSHELYHELSHLWNPPDTDQPSDRWNEGLASYLEWQAVERIEGRPALDRVADWLVGSVRGSVDGEPLLREVPMMSYGERGLTRHSYGVGGLFFHVLSRVVGEEALMAVVREYYQEHALAGASAAEFVALARARLGPPSDALFREWWLTTGWTDAIDGAETIDDVVARYVPGTR